MATQEEEDPNAKAEREKQALLLRCKIAKVAAEEEFASMLSAEQYMEDKVALLKSRATALFTQGHFSKAEVAYTRAIGLHACDGTPAPHALYSNRSACRSSCGDFEGALADAEECVRLSPTWAKGYVRLGGALHGLYRLDEAVRAYEAGLQHDPSLAALTDGLKAALFRRKAAGGQWEIAIDGGCADAHTGNSEAPLRVMPVAPSPIGGASTRWLVCVDGEHIELRDTERPLSVVYRLRCEHPTAVAYGRTPEETQVVSVCCAVAGGAAAAIDLYCVLRTASGCHVVRHRLDRSAGGTSDNGSGGGGGGGGGGSEGGGGGVGVTGEDSDGPAYTTLPWRSAASGDACRALGSSQFGGMALSPPPTREGDDAAAVATATLFVCDSGDGQVLALNAASLQESYAPLRVLGDTDEKLSTPVAVAAHGEGVAVADAANYRVALFRRSGEFVRCIGERASKFATAPRAAHFTRPPAHVALADGHLFVMEDGGASHVHVLDPSTAEPMGLLQPPFNAPPPPVPSGAPPGCLLGLSICGSDELYVSSIYMGRRRVLRLARTPANAGATGAPAADAAIVARPAAEAKAEPGYKKGFLLGLS